MADKTREHKDDPVPVTLSTHTEEARAHLGRSESLAGNSVAVHQPTCWYPSPKQSRAVLQTPQSAIPRRNSSTIYVVESYRLPCRTLQLSALPTMPRRFPQNTSECFLHIAPHSLCCILAAGDQSIFASDHGDAWCRTWNKPLLQKSGVNIMHHGAILKTHVKEQQNKLFGKVLNMCLSVSQQGCSH